MRAIEIFVRRPVIAVVVNLALVLIGLRAATQLPIQQYPAHRELVDHHHHGLCRRVRRRHPRLRHDADRARRLVDHGHRLCGIIERAGPQHGHGAAEAQPSEHGRACRGRQPARPDQQRAAARDRIAGGRGAARGPAIRDLLCERHVREHDAAAAHRLSVAQHPAAAQHAAQRAARRARGRTAASHADLARRRAPRGLRHQRRPTSRTRSRATTSSPRSAAPRATRFRSTCSPTRICARSRNSSGSSCARSGDRIVRISDIGRVELGSEEETANVRHNGKDAVYLSVWPLPGANEISVAYALRAELEKIKTAAAAGHRDRARLRRHGLHGKLAEGDRDHLHRDGRHRRPHRVPVPRLGAQRAGAARHHPDLAHRRHGGDDGDGILAQPADAARHRALGRPRRRRRDRRRRERLASHAQRHGTGAGGAHQHAAALRPDRGHDDYARRRLCADRLSLGPHGRAVQGVRVHAGDCRHRLGIRRGDAVADHERLHGAGGRARKPLRPLRRAACSTGWPRATAASSTGSCRLRAQILAFGAFISVLAVPLYMFSGKELAPVEDEGFIFLIVNSAPDASLAYTSSHMDKVLQRRQDAARVRGHVRDRVPLERLRRLSVQELA